MCQVVHSLRTGGAELLAIDFARNQVDLFDSYFVCLDDAGELATSVQKEGFSVVDLKRKPGIDFELIRRFGRWLKSESIDLIHAHQYTPLFYSSLARGILQYRPPLLFTEHGRHFPDVRKFKRCLLNQVLLSRTDRVVAVGEQVKRALVANEWIRENSIRVIYNGVSVSQFRDSISLDSRDELRRVCELPSDRRLVIQVARLNPLKDHLTAIRAMRQVVDQGVQANLLIVGEGETRAAIESEIEKLSLGNTVRLLGNRKDIPKLLASCDVFLLTSVSEGIPLTLIEAMIAGLPCVATSVGGIPEVINSVNLGLLSAAGDVSGIAKSLVRVLTDESLANSLSEAGRAWAIERFNDVRMHTAYRDIYTQMLGIL